MSRPFALTCATLAKGVGLAAQVGLRRALDAQVAPPEVQQRPAKLLVPAGGLYDLAQVHRVIAGFDDTLDFGREVRDGRAEHRQASLAEREVGVAERLTRQS